MSIPKQAYSTGLLAGVISGIATPAIVTGFREIVRGNYNTGIPVFFVALVIAAAALGMGHLKLRGLSSQKQKK